MVATDRVCVTGAITAPVAIAVGVTPGVLVDEGVLVAPGVGNDEPALQAASDNAISELTMSVRSFMDTPTGVGGNDARIFESDISTEVVFGI